MTTKAGKGSLGDILLASQIISAENIAAALDEQKRSGRRFGESLVELGIVTQEDIDWALSNQLDIPYIRLKKEMIDPDAVRLVPADEARKYNLIPLIKAGNELNIAIADPLNLPAIEAMELQTGCSINVSVALIREIREMIDEFYGSDVQEHLGFESTAFSEKALGVINADVSGAKLMDYLLVFALQNRLSSLSLQPLGDQVAINGRRSGVSRPIGTLASNYYPDISLRIRKGAGIGQGSEQVSSGLFTFTFRSHPIIFQAAFLAGYGGDYITVRPHVAATVPERLSDLHLPVQQESRFVQLSQARRGITFFASRNTQERDRFIDLMLEEIDTGGKNVIILGEGPGRMNKRFPRVRLPQGEVERAKVIMDALDHAPDILVIENATEAVPFAAACRAAMRGKLVLAGLEIRGTANVLRHLLLYQQKNIFLPVFVNGLVSFKGIQILCPECRDSYSPPAEELAAMALVQPPETFYRTSGCDACGHSGFSTRRFLLDVLTFDHDFLKIFERARDVSSLESYLNSTGYRGIAGEGLQLLMAGEVSPEEYIASVIL
ncbi:MAG TPA: pilus assembly protein PilB [Desulfuromonadales bacterium]|nr:pilus assembly protein PilB [Desulfuromonadales bacterium]